MQYVLCLALSLELFPFREVIRLAPFQRVQRFQPPLPSPSHSPPPSPFPTGIRVLAFVYVELYFSNSAKDRGQGWAGQAGAGPSHEEDVSRNEQVRNNA